MEQGETMIDLTELTNFEWTKAVAFGPYTTTEMMEETLGISMGFGGGEVLEDKGKIVGALGVSGGTLEQDTELAAYGKEIFEEVLRCL